MKIPLDYHIHSNFSEDGVNSLEEICWKAIDLGIPEIGFTEHWDVGQYENNPRFFKPKPWFKELTRLRELFSDQLTISAGVEIAEPHLYQQQADTLVNKYPFDYLMGSIHWIGSNSLFDEMFFVTYPPGDIYKSYFIELRRMVESDIDIVGHFDIPVRTAKPIIGYEPDRYEDLIRDILRIIIQRQLVLEINSAGLRKPARNLMPDQFILKWFVEMGGDLVTIGSDAHQVDQVGMDLDTVIHALQDHGLFHIARFTNRSLSLIELPDE